MSDILRGIIRAFDATTRLASVQLATAPEETITFRAADHLPAAAFVAGRECSVLMYTPDDPDDAVIITTHAPSGGPQQYTFIELAGQTTDPAPPVNAALIWAKLIGGVYIPHAYTSLGTTMGAVSMLGGLVGQIFAKGQGGALEAYEGAHVAEGLWKGGAADAGTPADGQLDTTHGAYTRFTTGAVAGNDAGLRLGTAGAGFHSRSLVTMMLTKFRLPTITSIRVFVGLTDQTLATMTGSDTPAGSFIGISFSTPRGDTTWQAVRNDGAGGQTNTNTAVTVTTSPFYLLTAFLGNFCLFVVFDSTFTQVYGALLAVTNLPASTTRLHPVFGVETQAAAARDIDLFYSRAINNV